VFSNRKICCQMLKVHMAPVKSHSLNFRNLIKHIHNEYDCKNTKLTTFKHLTFIGPYIASIFAEYNQQDAMFHNSCISVRRSTCFRWFFRPSSGAQNCTYSVRYLSDQYCYLLLAVQASSR